MKRVGMWVWVAAACAAIFLMLYGLVMLIGLLYHIFAQ